MNLPELPRWACLLLESMSTASVGRNLNAVPRSTQMAVTSASVAAASSGVVEMWIFQPWSRGSQSRGVQLSQPPKRWRSHPAGSSLVCTGASPPATKTSLGWAA